MILEGQTRKEIFWEHFGKMDDEEYRDKALRKIAVYAKEGIVIGKNLIATFEDYKNPIGTGIIYSYTDAIKKCGC